MELALHTHHRAQAGKKGKNVNGGLVFISPKQPAAGGAPPELKMLKDIETEVGNTNLRLWAHQITRGTTEVVVQPCGVPITLVSDRTTQEQPSAFSADHLGYWLTSTNNEAVHADGSVTSIGNVRAAFGVSINNSFDLEPGAKRDSNALCLFTAARLNMKKDSLTLLS